MVSALPSFSLLRCEITCHSIKVMANTREQSPPRLIYILFQSNVLIAEVHFPGDSWLLTFLCTFFADAPIPNDGADNPKSSQTNVL